MRGIRAFIFDRGRLALAVVLLALSLRLALPGGVMPDFDAGHLRVEICHGTAALPSQQSGDRHPAHETPCAFSALAFFALHGDVPMHPAQAPRAAEPARVSQFSVLRLAAGAHILPPAQGPPQASSA